MVCLDEAQIRFEYEYFRNFIIHIKYVQILAEINRDVRMSEHFNCKEWMD